MTLSENDRYTAVAKLAAMSAPGCLNQLHQLLGEIVPEPLPHRVAYELLLQSYLFFGYPQAIEVLRVLAEVAPEQQEELVAQTTETATDKQLRQRGERLCRTIYNPNYDRLIANMSRISLELAEWMVIEGYGRVLSRPGPAQLEREIASIIFLCRSGHPVQLFSHVRGARNLGAERDLLLSVVESSGLSAEQQELAVRTIDQVFKS
jgi:hypothetical protein